MIEPITSQNNGGNSFVTAVLRNHFDIELRNRLEQLIENTRNLDFNKTLRQDDDTRTAVTRTFQSFDFGQLLERFVVRDHWSTAGIYC